MAVFQLNWLSAANSYSISEHPYIRTSVPRPSALGGAYLLPWLEGNEKKKSSTLILVVHHQNQRSKTIEVASQMTAASLSR